MSGAGDNPQTPAVASFPVPPPTNQLPMVTGSGMARPWFFNWKQKIWAAIQGQGGLVDSDVINAPAPGQTVAAIEAALDGDPSAQAAVALLLGRLATFEDALQAALAPPPALASLVSSSGIAWKPVLAGSMTAGTQTYATQGGSYCLVGPLVVASFAILLSALDPATAGNVLVTGLPFPAAATSPPIQGLNISSWNAITLGAGYTQLGGTLVAGTKSIGINESGSALLASYITAGALSATSALIGQIAYFR